MSRCPSCFRPADVRSSGAGCGNCRATFPEGWHDSQVTCIAMAGARDTGKSIYIGALIPQLQQLVTQRGGVLRFATPEGEQLYHEHYGRPLFELRALMPPTPTVRVGSYQRTPLVLRIDPVDGPRHHVVIRDVAGEDLETARPASISATSRRGRGGVPVRPLSRPDVRAKLDYARHPARRAAAARSRHRTRLIGDGRPRIAVTLSKFDALQELAGKEDAGWHEIMRNSGAAFFRDPSFHRDYTDDDGALLHEEVRSLLMHLEAGRSSTGSSRSRAHTRATAVLRRVGARRDAGRRTYPPPRDSAVPLHGPVRWVCAGSGAL